MSPKVLSMVTLAWIGAMVASAYQMTSALLVRDISQVVPELAYNILKMFVYTGCYLLVRRKILAKTAVGQGEAVK